MKDGGRWVTLSRRETLFVLPHPPPPVLVQMGCLVWPEQLEQYSCEEMDGWRGGLDSVHLKKLPFIRAFWH